MIIIQINKNQKSGPLHEGAAWKVGRAGVESTGGVVHTGVGGRGRGESVGGSSECWLGCYTLNLTSVCLKVALLGWIGVTGAGAVVTMQW